MSHKVVIVGAGAAGVFTAYRLREMYGTIYDIELVESSSRIGGNTYTTHVVYGGHSYSIDCGAQFFYKNPQVSYVELLEQLGLFDADDHREIISAPAGFTLWDAALDQRIFHIPSRLGGFFHYSGADWERLVEFGYYLAYSYFLDVSNKPWTLSVDDWLADLHLLSDTFKQRVIKAFMYQFATMPLDRIGDASARYAVTYFVRNVFGEPRVGEPDPEAPSLPGLPVFETYQSTIGLDGILQRVLDQVGVVPALGSPVTKVVTTPTGVEVHTAWRTIQADHVVLACDPNTAADILDAGGSAPPALLTALRQMEYVPLPISMQKGSACYMPSDSALWEPVNTIVDGNRATFSCWFGPLRAKYGAGQQIPVFKSWASPGLDPAACPHEFLAHQHRILQPTTAFMAAREDVMAWQGHGGVWFAGGWTNWFDSQEAALDSATSVADRLPGAPRRRTGPARMRRLDPATKEHHLQLWLERMARQAPAPQGERLARAIDEVGSRI